MIRTALGVFFGFAAVVGFVEVGSLPEEEAGPAAVGAVFLLVLSVWAFCSAAKARRRRKLEDKILRMGSGEVVVNVVQNSAPQPPAEKPAEEVKKSTQKIAGRG